MERNNSTKNSSANAVGGEPAEKFDYSFLTAQTKTLPPLPPADTRSRLESGLKANNEPAFRNLPKVPPPIPENRKLTRFEELARKGGHADRETLPQFKQIDSGASLNAGHNKGFETRDLKGNSEILVYVRNNNFLPVPLEVKAGSSFNNNKTQSLYLTPYEDAVLRFHNVSEMNRYLSIDSQSDSFLVNYKIYSRGHYAKR